MISAAYSRLTPDPALRLRIGSVIDADWFARERALLYEQDLPEKQPRYSRLALPYTAVPFSLRTLLNRGRIAVLRRRNRGEPPSQAADTELDEERNRRWQETAQSLGITYDVGTSSDVVLTHDLDEASGVAGVEPLRKLERAVGASSAIGVLSARYQLDHRVLEEWLDDGCELFSHGYLHDGTDAFVDRAEMSRRLQHFFAVYPDLRGQVRGYRSGQLVRGERLYDEIAKVFDYDMTPPTIEFGGPHGWKSGCRTTHPFFRPSGLCHLPLSLSQDYFLAFVARRSPSEIADIWLEQTRAVWSVGGTAVLLIHPDNVLRRPGLLDAYSRFLQAVSAQGARFRLPGEVAAEVLNASRGEASPGS